MLPRVSTAFRFLTKTFYLANFVAVIAKEAVTAPGKPSGTVATTIPIPKMKFVITEYPTPNPMQKNIIPKQNPNVAIFLMKIPISLCKGLYPLSAVEAKFAI